MKLKLKQMLRAKYLPIRKTKRKYVNPTFLAKQCVRKNSGGNCLHRRTNIQNSNTNLSRKMHK